MIRFTFWDVVAVCWRRMLVTLALLGVLLLLVLAVACAALGPPLRSALEVVAPAAVDALAKAVSERWGEDAEVDVPTVGCFPAPQGTADAFGDDDGSFVYVTCRAKAREVSP